MRILYVEDNLANLLLVQRLARIGSHEIISHPDGEAALAHFQQDKPDLVLMDIQLKGALNGLEVVKMLREQGYKTPIIAVTAYAMVGDRERCLQAGCDEYLPKPLPVELLVELFERFDPKVATPAVVQTAAPGDLPIPRGDGTEKPGALTISLPPAESPAIPAGTGSATTAASTTVHDPVANGNPNPMKPEIGPGTATKEGEAPASQPASVLFDAAITSENSNEPTPENASRSAETGTASSGASQPAVQPSDAASREPPAATESNTPSV
jgi:CheY-like chemotaxis protein